MAARHDDEPPNQNIAADYWPKLALLHLPLCYLHLDGEQSPYPFGFRPVPSRTKSGPSPSFRRNAALTV
jgi:hypothetical protein